MEPSRVTSLPSERSMSAPALRSGVNMAIPQTDIVTFALDRVEQLEPTHVIYANANDPKECITAQEVRHHLRYLVSELRRRRIKAGDCVCLHTFNSIWYPLLWLGVIAVGAVFTGSNPAYNSSELAHHFKITATRTIVVHPDYVAVVAEAASKCGILPSRILVLGAEGFIDGYVHHPTYSRLLPERDSAEHNTFDNETTQSSTVAIHAATSGTTGLPKAAELSHRYLVGQAVAIEHGFLQRKEPMRQLVCLPVFHAFAAQLAIVLPLRLGMTTYFMPRFNLPQYVQYVSSYGITDVAIVPPIASSLLSAQNSTIESLRYVICAGAPLAAALQNELSSHLHPAATVGQCWGATELGWITLLEQSERDHSGSVGRLLPNTVLKIVDKSGNIVTADNVTGEAFIKSSSMLKQYHSNSHANSDVFDHDGYYRTGDCVFTDQGKVYIHGRLKEIMKVNGWQVSPAEIEGVIMQLEGVVDCAVVGHRSLGHSGLEVTQPRAFVVRNPGSTISESDIQDYTSSNLVSYKRLAAGVVFVDSIPRSSVGKILRQELSSMNVKVDHIEEQQGNCAHRLKSKEKKVVLDITKPQAENDSASSEAISHYVRAVTLVPLCCVLGFPGFILMCMILRQSTIAAKDR